MCVLVCEGVRERERERQTDRERERERVCVCVCVCARARELSACSPIYMACNALLLQIYSTFFLVFPPHFWGFFSPHFFVIFLVVANLQHVL